MKYDIDDLGAEKIDGAEMQVVHPVKGPIEGMTITLVSMDSASMQRALRAEVDITMKRQRAGKILSAEEGDAKALDVLVRATVAWTGFFSNGEAMACTPENVRGIYSSPRYAWIKRQVNLFLGNDLSFFES